MRTYPANSWQIGAMTQDGPIGDVVSPEGLHFKQAAAYAAAAIREHGPDLSFTIWWGCFDMAEYSIGRATYDPDKNHNGEASYIAQACHNATRDWIAAHPDHAWVRHHPNWPRL